MAPYGFAPAAPPPRSRVGDARGVFGLDPTAHPGDVPWGIRQILLATLVAAGPVVVLTLLALLVPADDGAEEAVTAGAAAFALVFTVLFDGWFALWAWFYSLRRLRLPFRSWGLRSPGLRILWLVPVTLVTVYILNVIYEVAYQVLAGAPTPDQDIVTMFPPDTAGVILFALMAVVVAPIFEEAVFRGFLFQGLASSYGVVPGAIVSAALFSAIHEQATVFVPLFVLGVALAWVFHATKSLWTPIALHAVFNAIAVLAWALSNG